MTPYPATLYVAEDNDFSLPRAAARLQSADAPPDRVEQVGEDELRVYFGDWCLKVVRRHDEHSRRYAVGSDDPNADGDRLADYLNVLSTLVNHFHGVVAFEGHGRDWIWRGQEESGRPLPCHLAGWLVRTELGEEGTYLEGAVCCPCGCERLEFHYPGTTDLCRQTGMPVPCAAPLRTGQGALPYWFGLKAVCTACRQECLLFDSEVHGDNAFGSATPAAAGSPAVPRLRLWPWRCLMCGSTVHQGLVHLDFDSPEEFLDKTKGRFRVERRIDAFGWFGMEVKCCGCGHQTPSWVGYETA